MASAPAADEAEHPPPWPHGPLQELFEDVFWVQGSFVAGPAIRFSRNMVVLRQDGALTLVNPVRLSADGEAALSALGTIRHAIRLDAFHGMDDAYYVDRHGAEFWSQAEPDRYPRPLPTRELGEGVELPIDGAEVFVFRQARRPEGAILVRRHGGLLITCDSVQDWSDMTLCSWPARLIMPLMGFRRTTIVGPLWLKYMTPEGGSLGADFERLLELPFDHLVSAHGGPCLGGAHDRVRAAVARALGD
jgi:hypothetical protein